MDLSRRATFAPDLERLAIGKAFDRTLGQHFRIGASYSGATDYWTGINTLNGGGAYGGVSEKSALTISTYMACIRVISEDIAKLPLRVFTNERIKNRPFKNYIEDDFTQLISVQPNNRITSYDFWKVMVSWLVGWGGYFAEKQFNYGGDLIALQPIHPSRIQVELKKDRTFKYKVYNDDGSITQLSESTMFSGMDFSVDGYIGYSTLQLMQNTLSRANSTSRYARHFFTNNGRPQGALITDESLSDKARHNIRDSWNEIYAGPSNAGKTAVLDRGIKYQAFAPPFKDLEFVAQEGLNTTEICKWMRVHPRKVFVESQAKGWATIDAEETEHFNSTLMPRIVGIEQNIKRQLFPVNYPKNACCEFDASYILRGDITTRSEMNEKRAMFGVITPNEWREAEGMNPIDKPEMDETYVQSAMVPLKMAGQLAAQKALPSPDGNNPSGK